MIQNGQIAIDENRKVKKELKSNPRTAIAQIDINNYLFVVSDGRTEESRGLTLFELATFINQFNVQTAYNLDGGGSTTLYFNNQVINKPSSKSERSVSDIIYVGY